MKILERLILILKVAAGLCLMSMVILTCADVVGSQFDNPVLGSEELVGLMGSLLLAFALPVTHHERGHIGVDLLYRYFPPQIKLATDVAINLIGSVFFFLIAWQSYLYAAEIKRVGQVSATICFPIHLILYGVSFACLVLALVILFDFFRSLGGMKND